MVALKKENIFLAYARQNAALSPVTQHTITQIQTESKEHNILTSSISMSSCYM